MEKKTMGAFIAALRKANGMTQQDVADRLNVSNKTVSKWERDEGYPEITMLPAIAELFEVTTDELLRGERIFREETENGQNRDMKSEKQAKYIFERVMTKFTNLSILSIALGVTALFISYFADFLTPYSDKTWVVILLAILMIVASVLIQIIAFNNLKPNLTAEDTLDDKTADKGKKKAILYLCSTVILAVAGILGAIIYLANQVDTWVMMPIGILLGLIIAFVIYLVVGKSLGIDEKNEYSTEYLSQRKKHIKVTAVIVSIVCIFSAAFPFAGMFIDYLGSENAFSFTNGIGYQFDSAEEAKNEYYKLKGYFEGKNELYDFLDEDKERLTITVYPVNIVFDETEEGVYTVVSATSSLSVMFENALDGDYYRQLEFDSLEEFEEYKQKYVWDNMYFNIECLERNIRFDDAYLMVYWQEFGPQLHQALDIMPVFILGASVVSLVIIGASALLWNKKKKRLM